MRHHFQHSPHLGFTLVELLIAMTLGLFVSSVATSAFYYTRKAILTSETVAVKNNVTQSMMLWVMDGKEPGDYPRGTQGPGFLLGRIDVVDSEGKQVYRLTVIDPSHIKDDKTITRTDGYSGCPIKGPGEVLSDVIPQGANVMNCSKCNPIHLLVTNRSGNTIFSYQPDVTPLYIRKK